MTASTFVFNQYYIDLLKKIKEVAKKHKDKSETAKSVLNSIKENYTTLNKSSDEYILYLQTNFSEELWESYLALDNNENINDWFKENGDINIFTSISLTDIIKLLRDDYLCHHYCTVFYIFKNNLSDETTDKIVKILQSVNNKGLLDEIEDEKIVKLIKRLDEIRLQNIKEKSGIDMKGIEDTSLGKLAKEILADVDIEKLQKSMGENGDVLKAIGDPNSGFSELISNVSTKMASKMANGELKQENLLQDAMKFASLMPGMFGGAAGGNANSSGKNVPDMSEMMNMMNMMNNMMSSGGSDEKKNGAADFGNLFKNMANKQQKGTKTTLNENQIKKLAKIKQLRSKLHKKNLAENDNIEE